MRDAHRDESLKVQPSKIRYSRVFYKTPLEKGVIEFCHFLLRRPHNPSRRTGGPSSSWQDRGECCGGVIGSGSASALDR